MLYKDIKIIKEDQAEMKKDIRAVEQRQKEDRKKLKDLARQQYKRGLHMKGADLPIETEGESPGQIFANVALEVFGVVLDRSEWGQCHRLGRNLVMYFNNTYFMGSSFALLLHRSKIRYGPNVDRRVYVEQHMSWADKKVIHMPKLKQQNHAT